MSTSERLLNGIIKDKDVNWIDIEIPVQTFVVMILDPLDNIVGIFSTPKKETAKWLSYQIATAHRIGTTELWAITDKDGGPPVKIKTWENGVPLKQA